MQHRTTAEHIIPFIEAQIDLKTPMQVLEIGCAEAGVLKAFTDLDHQCMGIELSAGRVELAKQFLAEEHSRGQIRFFSKNIYDIDLEKDIGHRFDLILLKDVIEHIHDQGRILRKLKDFLNPGGKIFFGFPPWQMPFGGHQQICKSKLAATLPYYHLLPRPIYKWMLEAFGENEVKVRNLLEVKETGISIERFERLLDQTNYRILKRQLFLFNPIYKYKFNLTPRKQSSVVTAIPVVRNFLSTCAYYLVASDQQ
ncbi:MAG: class I SAM-dependent methyltransferase [Bacteroidota bacterium]